MKPQPSFKPRISFTIGAKIFCIRFTTDTARPPWRWCKLMEWMLSACKMGILNCRRCGMWFHVASWRIFRLSQRQRIPRLNRNIRMKGLGSIRKNNMLGSATPNGHPFNMKHQPQWVLTRREANHQSAMSSANICKSHSFNTWENLSSCCAFNNIVKVQNNNSHKYKRFLNTQSWYRLSLGITDFAGQTSFAIRPDRAIKNPHCIWYLGRVSSTYFSTDRVTTPVALNFLYLWHHWLTLQFATTFN